MFLKGLSDRKKGEGEGGFGPLANYREQYDSPYWRKLGSEAEKSGHGGGDYLELYDFVQMVRQGREPWIDVYDSAAWSILYKCSRESMEKGGTPVPIPDFTKDRWKQTDWRKDHLKPVI